MIKIKIQLAGCIFEPLKRAGFDPEKGGSTVSEGAKKRQKPLF
jgi:hypothetical protein